MRLGADELRERARLAVTASELLLQGRKLLEDIGRLEQDALHVEFRVTAQLLNQLKKRCSYELADKMKLIRSKG